MRFVLELFAYKPFHFKQSSKLVNQENTPQIPQSTKPKTKKPSLYRTLPPLLSGLSLHACHNVDECQQLMTRGFNNRSVGATAMNSESSRSHSIFSIHVEMMVVRDDGEHIKTAKLHLVDLAGSERQAKTGNFRNSFWERI